MLKRFLLYGGQAVILQGVLNDEFNNPLKSAPLVVLLNGLAVGSLQTNLTGGFYVAGMPGSSGTYNLTLVFNGSETFLPCSHTQVLKVLPKLNTEMSLALSPNPVKMGATITLAGNLTDKNNNPIGSAQVEFAMASMMAAFRE